MPPPNEADWLTCGRSAATTGSLHSFIHATQWAIWIGRAPADRRQGLWVPGSYERITPTSQINSLELLFSQTPGMAGEDQGIISGCRPCQVSLYTLTFQAFLWGSIGWPAGGRGSSQEDSSSLLSKVWHHVCYIFETLGRRFFLASLQDIMDSPRELPQLLFQIEWWRYPKPE